MKLLRTILTIPIDTLIVVTLATLLLLSPLALISRRHSPTDEVRASPLCQQKA